MIDQPHDPEATLFVGVDGGGSRCRVRVRDTRGALRSSVEGGSANVYLDFDAAVRNIRDCVGEALGLAGPAEGAVRLGLGLAGVSTSAIGIRVAEALAGFGRVEVTHDADTACLGAHAGRDGGLIIAGTGSAAVARVDGRSLSVGGRGFIMGDDGSGGRLGLEALRRALRAHDGLEPATPLTRHLMAAFNDDPVAVIEWGRAARSSDFGAYAPVVCDAARAGDPVGLALVTAAAAAIADMAEALGRLGAHELSFVGGLSAALQPYLPARVATRLHEPRFDALEGALLLAGSPLPELVSGGSATNVGPGRGATP